MEVEIEDAVYAILAADAAVMALCAGRVYPGVAEPGAPLPYAVYEVPDDNLTDTLSGQVFPALASFSIDCYGATRAEARALRRAVRDALEGYEGDSPGAVFFVHGVFPQGGDTDIELPSPGDEMPVHRSGLNLSVGYSEN